MMPARDEAVARYLAVLKALLFVREIGPNAGPMVEPIQKITGNKPPDPWCASFVAYAGVNAFGKDWPLPKTASCQQLYEYGKANGLIVEGPPLPGDLLLVWIKPLTRFGHVASVASVKTSTSVDCYEGNANPSGGREGYGAFERTRTIKPEDALLRWAK